MSAIITSKFRLENASSFIKSVADESVYLMVGKSDAWSNDKNVTTDSAAPTPLDVQVEQNDVWQNAIALKKLGATDIINVAPRYTWTYSTVYPAWDDADEDTFAGDQFYVINSNYDVFKCLKTPISSGSLVASTIEPTTTNTYNAFKTTDGYVWKYMFSVATNESSKFLTNDYVPIKTVVIPPGGELGDLTADEQTKWQYQADCAQYTTGKIYRYVVVSGGSGYSSAPTVSVFGNGTGALATAVVSGGQVTEVYVTGEPNMTSNFATYNNNCGTGYSSAYVTLSGGGTGAVVRAVLSPKNGHGSDPVRELGAFYVESRIVLSGPEGSGDFIVGNAFRQIAMVKNPLDYGTTDISTSATLSALKSLTVVAGHTAFLAGDYITGGTSGAVAFVDEYTLQNDSTGLIKYHQNDKTGYTAFNDTANPTNGEAIAGHVQGTGSIAATSIDDPEVEPFTGEVMFIESRAPINRSASQIEDVRIIVEF